MRPTGLALLLLTAATLIAGCGALSSSTSPSPQATVSPSIAPPLSAAPTPTAVVTALATLAPNPPAPPPAPTATLLADGRCPASYYRAALTADRASYTSGHVVNVTMAVTNTSARPCDVPNGYNLTAQYPDGSVHPLSGGMGSGGPSQLAPGATNRAPGSWDHAGAPAGHYTLIWTYMALGGSGVVAKATVSFT